MPDGYTPDGVNIIDALTGSAMSRREKPLFWKIGASWPARESKPDHWASWAVVHDQWKLVANADLSHVRLFDITKDVAEDNDVKDQNTDVVESLTARLKSWQTTLPSAPSGPVFSELRSKTK